MCGIDSDELMTGYKSDGQHVALYSSHIEMNDESCSRRSTGGAHAQLECIDLHRASNFCRVITRCDALLTAHATFVHVNRKKKVPVKSAPANTPY